MPKATKRKPVTAAGQNDAVIKRLMGQGKSRRQAVQAAMTKQNKARRRARTMMD